MPPIAVLIALADPTRCKIIEILRAGPQPVHILAASFKISRPAISRHLRVLKHAKLISEKKLGRENRYALHAEKLKPLSEWLAVLREIKLPERILDAMPEPALQTASPTKAKGRLKTAMQAALPKVLPVDGAVKLPVAPALKRDIPISQMGFDF